MTDTGVPATGITRGRYEGLVLRLLRDEGPRSRTTLSDDTGLSPTTITKTVAPLLARGWVEEIDEQPKATRVGRPAITLRQVPRSITIAGVAIGVGVVRMGLTDAWGRLSASAIYTFDPSEDAATVIDRTAGWLRELIDAHPELPRPLAIGVAAPGAVDIGRRINLLAVNLGWHDVPIADILERRLGIPVRVDHNVRAMALAESRFGAHRAVSMAYFYVHKGVGIGLVLHGEPLFGGSHGVSELGHIRVRADGPLCACGARGCLETVVSEPHLREQLRARGVSDEGPVLAVLEQHRADSGVDELRDMFVDEVARALAVVINLFSPDVLVLGGEFAEAPDSLLDDVTTAIHRASFPLLQATVSVTRPSLADPAISGGAAVALEQLVYSDATDSR